MLFVRFNVSVPVSKLILKPAKRLVFNLGILQAGFCTDWQADGCKQKIGRLSERQTYILCGILHLCVQNQCRLRLVISQ